MLTCLFPSHTTRFEWLMGWVGGTGFGKKRLAEAMIPQAQIELMESIVSDYLKSEELVSIYENRQADRNSHGIQRAVDCVALFSRPCRISSGGRGTCYGNLTSNHARQGEPCSVS